MYRVRLVVGSLGWVDLISDIPLSVGSAWAGKFFSELAE